MSESNKNQNVPNKIKKSYSADLSTKRARAEKYLLKQYEVSQNKHDFLTFDNGFF